MSIDSDDGEGMPGEQRRYRCHACGERFRVELENDFGTYEFRRCPNCGSAKTTLAATPTESAE